MKRSFMERAKEYAPIDLIFEVLQKHPFIFTALLCVMLFPFGLAQASGITTDDVLIEAIFWIVLTAAFVFFGKPSRSMKVNIYLFLSSVAAAVLFSLLVNEDNSISAAMFVPVTFGIAQILLVLHREKRLTADRVVILLIVLGVVARYCYVLRYSSLEMQHDVGSFDGKAGHAAYITYWYDNGLTLPDFDVTTRWQFYHPPLHHMLMALLLRVFTTIGIPLEVAREAIQILPMIWSALSMAASYRIFKLLKLEGAGLVAATSVVCFYPTFIIWGGAINNDMLAAFCVLLAMLWTLKWYNSPTFRNILPIALSVGLGMMAKLSAWMVAPGIALVFLWVFIKNIKNPLPFIVQFLAFVVVCVPPALWWQMRNLIMFDVPITYVPALKWDRMSVESIPAAQRLFDLSASQFIYPFLAFKSYGAPYNEYNPFIALLKTSLFDEYHKPWDFGAMATFFVVIAGILAAAGFAGLIWMTVKRKGTLDLPVKLLLLMTLLTILVSYTIFCFNYPFVCTENIRYCIPIIPILAAGLGFGVNRISKKQ